MEEERVQSRREFRNRGLLKSHLYSDMEPIDPIPCWND